MSRSVRDVLFGFLGVVILLGGLILAEQLGGGNEQADSTDPVTIDGSGTDDGLDPSIPVTDPGSDATSATTTSSSTTTTLPAGPESISITFIQSTEPELWEDGEACGASPRTAVVTATIVGPNEIVGVVLGFAVDGPEFEMEWVEMVKSGPGAFSFELGPFEADTVADGSAEAILLAVEAADVNDEGAYDDSSLVLLLHDCEVGS